MAEDKAGSTMKRPHISFLPIFLGFILLLFIGILVFIWIVASQAGPVILDEKGTPR